MSEWEAALELDEALAGWLLQGPARGEWGWEWGWAASSHLRQEHEERGEHEEIPAVSPAEKEEVGGANRWPPSGVELRGSTFADPWFCPVCLQHGGQKKRVRLLPEVS